MGNRFREKTVEEGLTGEVTSPEMKGQELGGQKTGRLRGNRRRHHEPEPVNEEEKRKEGTKVEEEVVLEESQQEDAYASDEVEVQPRKLPNSRGGRVAKGVAKVLGGDILADKLVLGQVKLLLLCVGFMLLIVANRYQVESLSRKKAAVMEKVNELREQQIQLQRRNQNAVRISQIRDDLQNEKGLGIMPTPPEVI